MSGLTYGLMHALPPFTTLNAWEKSAYRLILCRLGTHEQLDKDLPVSDGASRVAKDNAQAPLVRVS